MSRKPGGTFLEDVPHPVQRLHVVLERRTSKQTHLGQVRRAQARFATLALDRFDHRRLFAADVGSGPAPKLDIGDRVWWIGLESGDFAFEDGAASMIFVA